MDPKIFLYYVYTFFVQKSIIYKMPFKTGDSVAIAPRLPTPNRLQHHLDPATTKEK